MKTITYELQKQALKELKDERISELKTAQERLSIVKDAETKLRKNVRRERRQEIERQIRFYEESIKTAERLLSEVEVTESHFDEFLTLDAQIEALMIRRLKISTQGFQSAFRYALNKIIRD